MDAYLIQKETLTAWADGMRKLTGTTDEMTPVEMNAILEAGDEDFIPSNIADGVQIFGVTGTRPHHTDSMLLSVSSNLQTGSVTATNGTDTVTGTLSNGEVFLSVPSDGTWRVNGTSGDRVADEGTGSLKGADNVKLIFFEATVGCYVMGDVSTTVTCTNGTKTYTSTGTGAHYFTVYERGTWTVSCTIDGQEWTYNAGVQTHKARYIEIFNGEVQPVLNDNDWTTISVLSSSSLAANYFAVGDTKEIVINGTVGLTTFSNLSIWAFILGFDHNPTYEGEGTIHFQIGKSAQTSGKNLCLIDSKYNSYISNTAGYFNMNYTNSNSGGWNASKMRTVLLGSNYLPSEPLEGSLLAALPVELRGVMRGCTKYSDNTGGGKDTASYVTATTDYLWLLSEWEVQGARTYANSAEQNYQQRYAYYANGNSRVFYRHSANTSTAPWWLRSTRATASSNFCYVTPNGGANPSNAYYCYGVAPAFCV